MTLHEEDPATPPEGSTTPPADAVGARPRTEVEAALRDLEAEAAAPHRQTQISRGALAGYIWVLGSAQTTPVTGDQSSAAPNDEQITAELTSAERQLTDPVRRDIPREYVQGVWDALAWVTGRSDKKP
ncbi:hypothetical protein GCM10010329_42820 [Streptomyces spiroverticillatus]|uniref:Uncharacterized protein n=1 Tax=Streptomyces finlayi TaxID=67296 RepID=A0A919CAX4_9ACTN|nr:hypothetical protein [Streptomyces finlayi]GHA15275.1 hypothetical protein GCM10010329_42820 [Streptomyces spiroverticillatus]GHC96782.1 hypothetical protein GCM10010334_37420 [Streptomyces finlayi]